MSLKARFPRLAQMTSVLRSRGFLIGLALSVFFDVAVCCSNWNRPGADHAAPCRFSAAAHIRTWRQDFELAHGLV
jgi:hypothetical protein